ncbi:hypothetical protein GGS21DRAFT_490007 [Xylaria nigripes]|nr:hypothetical protein GGS21DRAFT_490007 [Xylaria nigripes]
MAAPIVSRGARSVFWASTTPMLRATRNFHATPRQLADAASALPARKPVGAFRAGLFGFLLGTTLAGGAVYGYTLFVSTYVYVLLQCMACADSEFAQEGL